MTDTFLHTEYDNTPNHPGASKAQTHTCNALWQLRNFKKTEYHFAVQKKNMFQNVAHASCISAL
jgi:hypothetical protein